MSPIYHSLAHLQLAHPYALAHPGSLTHPPYPTRSPPTLPYPIHPQRTLLIFVLPLAVTLLLLYASLRGLGSPKSFAAEVTVRDMREASSFWSAMGSAVLRGAGQDKTVPPGYVPVRIGTFDGENTPVELCKLDFDAYSRQPWHYPMFRDLVALCGASDRIMRTLGDLASGVPLHSAPAGFIFHESRVGSTLLCNMLAADTDNAVYSESHPLPSIALHCPGCDRAMQVCYRRGRGD